jgi:peptide/nickel transport system substrate-binding protein
MRKAWAFCIAAALLSGCSRNSAGSAQSQPGAAAHRIASAVRFDLAADPSNLNPLFLHQDAASVEQQVARLSFEPFIDFDPAGREIPELLSRVPSQNNGDISGDGRTIIYRLRPGVRWSDGTPVTSGDVLFTLRAILDPRNPVPSRDGYDLIDRAQARGKYAVVFHLKHAWAPAVDTFFSYGYRPQFVLPAHVLRGQAPLAQAPFNAAPTVGDGPYTFVSWRRGESLLYVANPRYWRGAPRARRLDIRIIPDPATNLVLLQSRELDWNLIAPLQQNVLRSHPDIVYRYEPTSVVAGLVLNVSHAPLNDVRVRRALAMAIDRRAISRKITLGRYPVTDVLQPSFSWAFDASVKEPQYDPAGADKLFDAAGWRRGSDGTRVKVGQALTLVYVQFKDTATGMRVATMVQAELRQRGIDAQMKTVSGAQLFLPSTGILASGNFDLAYVPFTMGSDPDDSSILRCGATSNYMRYCNHAVDALETAALISPSRPVRKALYARIEQLVAADVPIVYLFDANYIYAYRNALTGFYPNAFLPTWNAYNWRLTQ